ncbi:MAG: ABC transporter ATP-binding protein [Caldisericaceae bacterium]
MSDDKNVQQRPIMRGGPMGGGQAGLRGAVEKPKDFWGTLKRLVKYLKPQTLKLSIVMILAIGSTAFAVYAPKISGNAVNEITNGFVAKSLVSGISKMQQQYIPKVQDMLQKMQAAEDAAAAQASEQVIKQLGNTPAAQEAAVKAAEAARAAVQKSFLESAKLTADQLSAMKQIVALPVVNTITDYNKRADTIQQLLNLSKNLPLTNTTTGGQTQQFNVSQTDLDKGIDIIRQNGGSIPFDALGKILLFLLMLYLLSAFLTFLVQYIMSDVAQKTTYLMRKELYEKLTVLPLRYYDSHTTGEIMSRMTNDLDTVSTTLQQSITQLIISATQIIGYIYMMLTISGKLTLITLATLPLYVAVMTLIIKVSQRYFLAQQTELGRLSSHAEEMYTGHNVVKAFGHEKDAIDTFEGVNKSLFNANWRAQFISGIMMPLTNFVSNIGYVLIAVAGGIYVTKNLLNLGDIVAFIQYSRNFSQPIVQIANISNVLQSTMACAERVFGVLDEQAETPDPADAIQIVNPRGQIKFDHVAFSYSEDKPLFRDMNLNVNQGDTIAIVGPTGAGKTTLVNLLMRFYDVQKGSITFDENDIRKFKRGDLRTKFGMVLQDTWLFNGTIRENIAYGREDATEEEIVAAAKAAQADHFIRSLPDGYNTVINEEGTNISAGEKQLLTIARAFLANPTVLILDEATSSVDTRTEVLIQKAMSTLMQGRTNFVIAHRLSTIRDARNILVMNHGAVIEQGNHKELLAKKGFYADLYNSQFLGAEVYEATD